MTLQTEFPSGMLPAGIEPELVWSYTTYLFRISDTDSDKRAYYGRQTISFIRIAMGWSSKSTLV